jgi:serine O-acetyltransferase
MDPLSWHRIGRYCLLHHIPLVPRMIARLTLFVFHCVVPPGTEIGAGTRLGYGGMGVVLHHRARIGRDVVIAQQVTIGGRSRYEGVPVIEDRCFIGAGARILGPVRIGAGAIVGANAVVIRDVPPGAVVGGVPAKILSHRSEAAAWRRA